MSANKLNLEVQPYDWVSSDRDGIFSMRIWCHNKDSERVLLRVEDYQPFCRLELPSFVGGKNVTWNEDALRVYAQWLRSILKEDQPTTITFKQMSKLYYYQGGKTYPFLICRFENENAMTHCVRLINKQGYKINQLGFIRARVHETSVSSIHRMITEINIGYGSWLQATGELVPELDRISTCPNEYLVSFNDLKTIPQEETKGWSTSPKVGAIDIECYSNVHRSMPNKNYATDVVFQISYISQTLGDPSTRKKYLLVLGNCGDIEGAEVLRFDHELHLIDAMCDLIVREDPSIITGYNIFKFDFPYLDARKKLYGEEWKSCGLIKDYGSYINIRNWKSGAYGFMTIATLEAEGRLNLDMYPIIKRDHKLDRYTLDFVAHHFLGKGKHDVTARQMFEIFQKSCQAQSEDEIHESAQDMGRVGAYCLEDSCLCIDLMEKTNTWIALIELSTIVEVTMMSIFTRGQQIRVYNQIYSYAYREDVVVDQRDGDKGHFTGGFVGDPIVGKKVWIAILDFASLYPSLIQRFNLCYTTLVPPESQVPDSMCHVLRWVEEKEGEEPVVYNYRFIKKKYRHGILPRMCYHLVTERRSVRSQIGPHNDEVTNIVLNQRQGGLKISSNSVFGFTAANMLPIMEIARTITAMGRMSINMGADHVRDNYHGEIAYGDTDSIMPDLHIPDPYLAYEMAEKMLVTLNTLYKDPLRYELDGFMAAAIFIKKKKYAAIMAVNEVLKEGDTYEEIEFAPEYKLRGKKLYQVNLNSKGKTLHVVIPDFVDMTDRKRIIGLPVGPGGKPDPSFILKKGILIARRDNCIWSREVYTDILISVMFDRELEYTQSLIDDHIIKMMTRQVPFGKMMVTREIGSNYKPNSSYPLKLFADELRRAGHPVQGGERIDYVFVRCSDPVKNEKQGYKMRIPEMYWDNCEEEHIDPLHYIEKIIKNPVEQIFYLGHKEEIDEIEARCEPEVKRRGKIYTYMKHDYINTWVKLIKYKENMVQSIKIHKPHFDSQDPYFTESHRVPIQIEIVDE